jgi:sec-independent protein translocase protein TatA
MPNVGPIEIIVVLLILLVIFGPKRIPELGRSVGHGMRNFKQSVTGRDRDEEVRGLESESHAPAPGSQGASGEAPVGAPGEASVATTPAPPEAGAGPAGER